MNDLGLSGEGGAQESETLIIHLIFDAINDGPLLELPDSFAAQEDVPLLLSGISVFDADYHEPGGEALHLGCARMVSWPGAGHVNSSCMARRPRYFQSLVGVTGRKGLNKRRYCCQPLKYLFIEVQRQTNTCFDSSICVATCASRCPALDD